MAYSTDADLEQYLPGILDNGVPAIIEGGLSTTLASAAAAGATSIVLTAATGLQANDYLKIDKGTNCEIVQVNSVAGAPTITLKTATPLRKNHKSGAKVQQVDGIGFSADHSEAKDDLDRIIEIKWFRPRVRERFGRDIEILDDNVDFDPDLMLNASTQLKKASAYWVLGEYVLPKLSKETNEPDAWRNRAEKFKERFSAEIDRVMNVGIDYDWDSSGAIESDENKLPATSFRVGRG